MYFCYRWMLILFKREFQFQDLLRLWEAMWSGYLTENAASFLAIGILQRHAAHIMRECVSYIFLLWMLTHGKGKWSLMTF